LPFGKAYTQHQYFTRCRHEKKMGRRLGWSRDEQGPSRCQNALVYRGSPGLSWGITQSS
jgi:hypothetical protein